MHAVRGLYSANLVRASLGDAAAAEPDAFLLLNADAYMPYWRRTLAGLLQSGKPIVLTLYCQYEGASNCFGVPELVGFCNPAVYNIYFIF